MTERSRRWAARLGLVGIGAAFVGSCLAIDPLRSKSEPLDASTADTADGVVPDAADASDVGPADGDGGQCTVEPVPGDGSSYAIRHLSGSAISVDGDCSDPAWAAADVVEFKGTRAAPPVPSWRLLWDPASNSVFGCATVSDTQVISSATSNDSTKIYDDDRLEYYLVGDLATNLGPETVKVYLTAGNYYADSVFYADGGEADWGYVSVLLHEAQVDGTVGAPGEADADTDVGYTLEWQARVPFTIAPGQLARCEFAQMDLPAAVTNIAFGTGINNEPTWGYCVFACPQ